MMTQKYFKIAPLHPLICFVASFIIGIITQSQATHITPLILVAGLFTFYKSQKNPFYPLLFCFFIFGSLRYEQQINKFNLFYLSTFNKKLNLIGTITDIEPNYRKPGYTTITIKLKKLFNQKVFFKTNEKIKITTKEKVLISIGDTIQLPSLYFRPIENKKYRTYLAKEQIGAQIYTKNEFTLIKRPTLSINRWLKTKRNAIIQSLKQKLQPRTFTLVASIFFGKKLLEPQKIESIKQQFKKWGIIHYMARSGLHLLIIIALLSAIMQLLPAHFILKQIITIALITLYMLLSWPSISFYRAFNFFIIHRACILLNLQTNVFHLFLLVCLVTLITNPLQLFFLDFQLSFGFTLALTWLNIHRHN